MDVWVDAELQRNREDLERFRSHEYIPLNALWERLDARSDFRADQERAALRPRLLAAEGELRVMEADIAVRERRERLVNVLRPVYRREHAELEAVVARWSSTVERPDRRVVLDLFARGRHLDYLRRQLFQATGDVEFGREWWPMDALKTAWDAQAKERARIFSHDLSPAHRPATEPPAWAGPLQELVEVQQAATEVLV